VAILVICAHLLLGTGASADWPQFRHDPARTGLADGPGPTLMQAVWSTPLGAPVHASAAVVAGAVYVADTSGVVYCVDAETGQVRWSTPLPDSVTSSPAVSGQVLVIGCVNRFIYGLNAASGAVLWRLRTGRSVVSSPAVVDGTFLCGSTDGSLYAGSLETGKELWRTAPGGEVQGPPAVLGDRVYYGDMNGHVYAVRLADGQPLWPEPYAAQGPILSGVTATPEAVVAASLAPTQLQPPNTRVIHVLAPDTGQLLWAGNPPNVWAAEKGEESPSAPVLPTVLGGGLFFSFYVGYSNSQQVWVSAALATGARAGALSGPARNQVWPMSDSSPAVADGVLYFGDYGGHLCRISIADQFAPLPWLDLGAKVSASPAISDGRLYVGTADGKLHCIQ